MIRYRVGLLLTTTAFSAGCFNPEDPAASSSDTEEASTSTGTATSSPSSTSESTVGSSSSTESASSSSSDSLSPTEPTTDTGTAGSAGSVTSEGTTTGNDITCSPPQELSAFPTVSQTHGVALRGIFAYVTETNRGLHVIDIADPSDIAQLGDADLPNPRGIAVAGGFAFVADPTGLIAVDVSTPAFPTPGAALSLGASVAAVEVVGDVAYAVTEGNGDPCPDCGLYMIDVADPTAMSVSGSVPIGDGALGVAVEGSIAYVAAGFDGLVSVDLATSTILDSVPTDGFASDVVVAGEAVYLAAGSGGLEIFDVSDPANITELGAIGGDFVLGVAVEGNWAWIADSSSGLRVIDISDPSDPVELAAVNTFGSGSDVAVENGIAFVTSWDGDLRVFAPPICR